MNGLQVSYREVLHCVLNALLFGSATAKHTRRHIENVH